MFVVRPKCAAGMRRRTWNISQTEPPQPTSSQQPIGGTNTIPPPARTAPPPARAASVHAPFGCAARRTRAADALRCCRRDGNPGRRCIKSCQVRLPPRAPPPCAPPPHRNCSCTPRNCSDRVPVCSRVRCCVCVSPPKAKRTPLAACPQLRAALCSLPPGALASCGTAPDARRPTLVSDACAASRFAVAERSRPDFKRACALSCC